MTKEPDLSHQPMGDSESQWVLYVDGASNANGSSIGIILVGPEGWDIQYTLRFKFSSTNNEAEYEALLIGLAIAHELGVQYIKVNSDSKLVVGQVQGEYGAKEENMKQYLKKSKDLLSSFRSLDIQQIP